MPPQTHYAKSAEVNIAYQVVGDGPLDLVFVPGFISHLDLQWADPRIARFLEKLASFSRLIMFDKRGTGLSDPVAAPAPLEDRMDDVRAVMDAAGSERAALFGLSEGGAMSVLFAATYPEHTRALLLCSTFPNGTLDPDDNPGGQRWVDGVQRVRSATEHWGEGRTLAYMAPSADSERDRIGRGIFERSAASPQMAQTLIDMVLETDVRELLPTLRVPTLVLHRAEEFVPVECARYMAKHIPGARLVVLPGMDHILLRRRRWLRREDRGVSHRCPSGAHLRSHPHDRDVHRHRRLHRACRGARRRALARAAFSPRRAHARRARAPPGS